MNKKLNIEELIDLYVNKTFGWLTINSVYRDDVKGRYYFKCTCKCGKEVCKQYNKVISGHTKSCGCYKFSKDYADFLSNYWSEHKEEIDSRVKKFIEWCKDNKDVLIERGKIHSLFYKEHPEVKALQIEKRKKTLESNPEIQSNINSKLTAYWSEELREEQSQKQKELHLHNPEISKKISLSLKDYYRNNPDKKEYISNRVKDYYRNNPDKIKQNAEKHKEWFKSNRLKVIEQGLKQTQLFESKRKDYLSSEEFSKKDILNLLLEACHPDYIKQLLSGKIKSYDKILTKCPICGKYSEHLFGNVWRLYSYKFRTNNLPLCDSCRNSLTTSSYENTISSIISTFYKGTTIKNSRDIISPLELDLFYPEKKIAIEFNGDYWHSEEFKQKDYHYNKFISCYNKDILLVNIFEKEWKLEQGKIILYIKDLFNDKVNNFSFVDKNIINLNYPPPHLNLNLYTRHEDYYLESENRVYTCGYASL